MCGRFSLTVGIEQLQSLFRFVYAGDITPRFNIAPNQEVLTVFEAEGKRIGKMMKWGLVPSWANDPKIGWKMINARAETVDEKASFRRALKRRRCLILADGFYEWKKEGTKKIPYRFTLQNGEPFAFAGAWKLFYIFWLVPKPLRDGVYDFVAKHRYEWFGKRDHCLMPTPDVRARFLDERQ